MPDFRDFLRQEGRSRSMDHSPLTGPYDSGTVAAALKGTVYLADEINSATPHPTGSRFYPVHRLTFGPPADDCPAVRYLGGGV